MLYNLVFDTVIFSRNFHLRLAIIHTALFKLTNRKNSKTTTHTNVVHWNSISLAMAFWSGD